MIESVRLLGAEALLGKQPWNTHIGSSLRSIGSERPADTTDILFDSNNPEMKIEHPVDPKRTRGLPRIFLGPIASANELLKDPVKRDALRDHFGVKAVEMEGSGIADATWISGKGYLVIRGICDYCDIHKNDVWQEYASAVAAGYAVALIESMPSPYRIDPERPPPKGISIPTPGIGTSTVTSSSRVSSL
jgi:nucleoside phosphorylase